LMTREPPRIQIQVGQATRTTAFPESDREELFNRLSTQFRAKQYDDGLMEAVDFIRRQMEKNLGASRSAANRSGSSPGAGSAFPPPPGGGGTSPGSGTNRTSSVPPGAGRPDGLACGGGTGTFLCMAIAVIGVIVLLRGVFARRSGGYGGGYGGMGVPA